MKAPLGRHQTESTSGDGGAITTKRVRRRGRPSRSTGEVTRKRVLEAARHAFATQGFSGATMRSIAEDAGVTAMALYNYAPSKSALFDMVWQGSLEAVYTEYGQVVAGLNSLVEEFEALLNRSRDMLADNPDHVRLVVRILVEREYDGQNSDSFRVTTVTDFFSQFARRSVERGEIVRSEKKSLVVFTTTLLWGITTLTAADPEALDAAVAAAKWAVRRQFLA